MFGKFASNVCLTIFILFCAGCSVFSTDSTGLNPTEIVDLDAGFEFEQGSEKGDLLALDMREPKDKGRKITGASFDPAILELVNYLQYESDGIQRVQYVFDVKENGTTDVFIKVEPVTGGGVEVYKRVTVNVGTDKRLF